MIRAVFILTEGGILLYSKTFDSSETDPFMVSSFMSAISSFSREAVGNQLQGIEADDRYIFHFTQNPVTVVVLADHRREIPGRTLEQIALSFISKFAGDIRNGDYNSDQFSEFDEALEDILPRKLTIHDSPSKIDPLDGLSIVELPTELQNVAKLVLRENEISPEQVAKTLRVDLVTATEQLDTLVELGKIRVRNSADGTVYHI